jgi:hypothetical protein
MKTGGMGFKIGLRGYSGEVSVQRSNLCIGIFYCKTCKTKESMMGQFNDRFVYLQNYRKVAKYGIGKRLVRLVFGIKD